MNVYDLEMKLSKQEDGLWRAEIPSLPGCFVDGPIIKDVMRDIQACAAMALDLQLELGSLPSELQPQAKDEWLLRIPVVIGEHSFKRFPIRKAGKSETDQPTRDRKASV